jgi:hypothetical protein
MLRMYVLRFMIDLPDRGVVANATISSWGADLKKMSGIARDAQRDPGSGYEPEDLLARTREVQPGFPLATLEAKKSIRLIAHLQPVFPGSSHMPGAAQPACRGTRQA